MGGEVQAKEMKRETMNKRGGKRELFWGTFKIVFSISLEGYYLFRLYI